ncbi:hypothetical protein N836_12340 [Leptolyngbya sp. Heron Island J]|uniref:hypothetical protein n=1 Tax=Leptolyngbya sp. Heron Island J TaxID=1385935 RepID=UPI0003B9A843|nr:hypothetical protein [Leptolyngbya sp. Heron Island J]ESA35488.1 hypothetical protein N836_12340 [Leptolyngbya sp. Heron Island J]
MFNLAQQGDSLPDKKNITQGISSHGAQLPTEKSDNNDWQTVHFPGTVTVDQLSGTPPNLQTNAMDSSSTRQNSSIFEPATSEQTTSQRETELLNLVRDLNECNDVLLAKVSQLEESLERSQAALQSEIDRADGDHHVGDREIAQLVTELEQSNQALQHHQMLNETLQTELTAFRERSGQLEAEHKALLRQHTTQAQELLQANTNCRDLRARLQRQQRYTLQFKAALEKCLSMAPEPTTSSSTSVDASSLAMPKSDEIRPWDSTLGNTRLDPQLESMIRGLQGGNQTAAQPSDTTLIEAAAEDQLWHDLARVMEPGEVAAEDKTQNLVINEQESPQFTEPSPWTRESDGVVNTADDDSSEKVSIPSQLSPQASEILARVQSAQVGMVSDTYLPAMSAQSSPSPVVNPLRPQKRISSLSAIDLPNFPRLKKQPPTAKA